MDNDTVLDYEIESSDINRNPFGIEDENSGAVFRVRPASGVVQVIVVALTTVPVTSTVSSTVSRT